VRRDILDFAWALVIAAGLTGAAMVTIGMFEELPAIIRSTLNSWRRPR